MAAPNSALQGWVARSLRAAAVLIDGSASDSRGPRMSRYSEQMGTVGMVGEPQLCDEGAIYTASMLPGATALQLGVSAVFSATNACLVCKNQAPVGSGLNQRIQLRDIHFNLSAPPAAGTSLQYATVIDDIVRTPTTVSILGTAANGSGYAAPNNCSNMDEINTNSPAQWWFPQSTAAGTAIVVPAAGADARTIVGNGLLRAQIPVGTAAGASDDYRIVFGATDRPAGQLVTAAPAGASRIVEPHPAVSIGPQQTFLFYLWSLSNAATGLAFLGLDVSYIVR